MNKTSGFEVLRATRAGDQVTLSLKNNYAHSVTAFVLTFGKGFQITEDFITSEVSDDVGIQPQQTFEKTYTLPSTSASDQLNAVITLEAVVLADKSGDGDVITFEDVRDTRLGQAVQIKRSLRIFEKYINDTLGLENLETEMRAALDRPEQETLKAIKDIRPVGTINRKTSDPLSDSVKEGLAAGRTDVLRRLDEAKMLRYNKDFLLKTKAYFEKLLNRL